MIRKENINLSNTYWENLKMYLKRKMFIRVNYVKQERNESSEIRYASCSSPVLKIRKNKVI